MKMQNVILSKTNIQNVEDRNHLQKLIPVYIQDFA